MTNLMDKTNKSQKLFAYALLGGAIFGAIKLFNAYFAPVMILFMKNLWTMLLIGTPLVLVAIYVIANPAFIWGFFKTLSWKLTSWLIKMDPLSVMDRYVDYLKKKLVNLTGTVQTLVGKKVKLDRNIDSLKDKIGDNLHLGQAAIKQSKTAEASAFGVKVATDKATLKMLVPLQTRLDKNLEFLKGLSENWEFGIEKLQYQIQGKRAEYEIIKETTRGLKSAEDFINSDNESARLYGQGLKALEESVTQKIGYIEEFERRSKGMMNSISIEKQAIQDEGLQELEQYMNDGKLELPDFTNLDAPVVEANGVNIPTSKFNLLK